MLRRSELDSLRGAISLDPSSVPAKNETRLRDFHWKPAGKPSQEAHLEQLTLVAAPEPGKIVSLADGLKIGTVVRKGNVIAEYIPLSRLSTLLVAFLPVLLHSSHHLPQDQLRKDPGIFGVPFYESFGFA